jgi:hypothetical protein
MKAAKAGKSPRSLSDHKSSSDLKGPGAGQGAGKGETAETAETDPYGANCAKTCYGYTCDQLMSYGYTCAALTKQYGCDCGGCTCSFAPSPAPTGSGKCASTCSGYTCDYLGKYGGYTCATLERIYGCDCSGCGCTYGLPTQAPTLTPTSQGAKDWSGVYTTSVNDQGQCGRWVRSVPQCAAVCCC